MLHAGWNVLLAGARDSVAAAGALFGFGALWLAPAALLTGADVSSEALPYVAVAAGFQLLYFVLLARAYGGGELGVVYPVGRGFAPIVVLGVSVVVLGVAVSALAALGVGLVALGVGLLAANRPGTRRDLVFGLAIGASIAGYTLVDSEGIRYAEPLSYLFLVTAPCAAAYCAALIVSGRAAELRAELTARNAVAAAAVAGAYAMVLAALQLAPAAPVAAVRESSVVLAALFAWLFLGEPRRLFPAVLVAGGVAAIALS